jgi:REP element-mobilizing transposase RayT
MSVVDYIEPRRRKTMRLPAFDYSSPCAYFFTVVTQGRVSLFGNLVADEMELSAPGRDVVGVWVGLSARFATVELDEFILMPNHAHGIVWLNGESVTHGEGAASSAPTTGRVRRADRAIGAITLGKVMRAFKSLSARAVNERLHRSGSLWQRGYYERVSRSERELHDIRQYILHNPAQWVFDRENALEVVR